ncbi:MAG: rhodanese-like domain-containing protein [Thiothrix sp.]|jgi:rhodanese-related sulfurtransferase|nr:MAG: rhodanese-like domain-containing protein [Thiothrix sp.]
MDTPSVSSSTFNDDVEPTAPCSDTSSALSSMPAEIQQAADLAYAGIVSPTQAWAWFQAGEAVIVDVRTKEELHFVGQVPGSLHVAWANGTAMNRNPRFVKELEAKLQKQQKILLLCRSGKRSAEAAKVATQAGFTQVYNIAQGFEGDLNAQQQRGTLGGWRYANLPWQQN